MAFFTDLLGSGNDDDKLPEENTRWPPWDYWTEYKKFAEWAAWYSGDPVRLSDVYSQLVDTGDIQGRIWSDEIEDEVRTMLHVPLAGDIASVSADLLFGEAPDIKIPEAHQDNAETDAKNAQDRLDEIVAKADVDSRSVKAAEAASSLGGCFLKADWAKNFKQFPLFSVVQHDNALPVFQHGFLRKILFHQEIKIGNPSNNPASVSDEDVGTYLRHLEYREPGLIQHGLYEGTANNLGDRIPLDEHWKTEPFAEEPTITHDLDDILVRYVPNKRPNRLWRTSALGQSDYQGIEGLMDALDATYTSWIRDLKLAKARLLVPRHMLEKEDGNLKFNLDQSVFTALESAPTDKDTITAKQFDIRSKQHKDTAMELFMRAVDSAGFSPQTFGMEVEGRAESGTALKLRERKSVQTKNKKERHFATPLAEILREMLKIDQMMDYPDKSFDANQFTPRIEFGSSFKPTMNELADTLDKINRANAASTEVKVRLAHPDWSEDEVEKEVERLRDELGMNVEEPEMRE